MPPLTRLLLLILSLLTTFFLFFYLSLSTIPYAVGPSLFPRSAIISLTDDNSTSFGATPAAFGPMLPGESKGGLTGQLFVVEEGELGCGDVKEEGVWGMGKGSEVWVTGEPGDDAEAVSVVGPEKLPITGLINEKDPLDGDANKEISLATPNTGFATLKSSTKKQRSKASFEDYKLSLSSEELELASHADIETLQDSALMEGRIVLIQRGGCGFLEKVLWAQRRGALALIVGDSKMGGRLLTMYARGDTSNVTIPSIFTTYTTAHLLTSLMPPEQDLKESNGRRQRAGDDDDGEGNGDGNKPHRDGLWLTLMATRGSTSSFFDTLLVLVISPLITLGIVYVMLTLRASIQRRKWRAPKSVVDSFPVRTYTRNGRECERIAPRRRHSNGAYNSEAGPLEFDGQSVLTAGAIPTEERRPQMPVPPLSAMPPLPPRPTSPKSKVRRSKESTLSNTPFHSTTTECVICLEDYVDGVSRVMCLPCGHEFHVECITPWLVTRRRTCPICKIDVVKGRRDSIEGDEVEDLEIGSGIESDSSSSGDDSSGYEVDEVGRHRSDDFSTSHGGLFDWRRVFGGIGLGLGHERMNHEAFGSQVDEQDFQNVASGLDAVGGHRGSPLMEAEANERTPLITEHVTQRI